MELYKKFGHLACGLEQEAGADRWSQAGCEWGVPETESPFWEIRRKLTCWCSAGNEEPLRGPLISFRHSLLSTSKPTICRVSFEETSDGHPQHCARVGSRHIGPIEEDGSSHKITDLEVRRPARRKKRRRAFWIIHLGLSSWFMRLWVKTNGIPCWLIGAPPILVGILVGIGMFTGGQPGF